MLKKKVYRSHILLMMLELIEKILEFGSCLFILFLFILPYMGIDNPGKELWPMEYLFFFGFLVITTSALWAFVWCNIQIEVTDGSLRFIRRNKIYAEYPLDAQFSSKVEKNYSQHGLFTGTNRFILINIKGHKNIIHRCRCIKKDDYADMMAELKKAQKGYIKRIYEDNSISKRMVTDKDESLPSKTFHIPRDEFISGEKKYAIQVFLCAAIISTLFCAIWYFAIRNLITDGIQGPTIFVIIISIIFGVFCMFVTLLPAMRYFSYIKKLPERIVLELDGLRIDEIHIPVWEIKRIEMTPPDYAMTKNAKSSRRRMVIKGERGVAEYQIGNTDKRLYKYRMHKFVYHNYDKLCAAVEKWCEQNEVKFILQYE